VELTCKSDAVIVGRATTHTVMLNNRETFLISTFKIDVWEWIRPHSVRSIANVAVLGGKVRIGTRTLSARYGTWPPDLSMLAILFLVRIPETTTFALIEDSLLVSHVDDSFVPFDTPSKQTPRHPLERPGALGIIRAATETCGSVL
jgi:hypothetical protein